MIKKDWCLWRSRPKKRAELGQSGGNVHRGKYKRVKRMASVYLKGREVACRIDMVAVVLDSNNESVSVKHYENVTGL